MTQCQPPNCPCFCPTAGLPIAPVIVAQGGPGVVIVVPIYGTQGFSVSIVTNPLLPIGQNPLIASVQMFNGNELTITTAVPNVAETLGTYVALLKVCNACGELTIQITVEVAADITPIVTNCALAQLLWTPEARVPTVGDQLLAFTPAGCRALLPPDVCATLQAFPGAAPQLVDTVFGQQAGACVEFTLLDVLALVDVCAALNALPVGAPLAQFDRLIVLQGANCVTTTVGDLTAAVDICTLLQNLPNAVVQPTAAFYGQQGGACFEFLVSDLLALAVPPFPLLAPNGSCLAPSYSFTSSPDSGMWYDAGLGAVTISDDNCNDFIRVGASVVLGTSGVTRLTLSSAGAITATAAPGQSIALQSSGGVISLSNTTSAGSIFIGSAGNVTMSAAAGQVANVLAPNAQIQAFAGGQITLANTLLASPASLVVTSTGKIRFATGTPTIHRFEFTEFGEIRVGVPPGDTPGVAGQVFTSAGPGAAALWQTPAVVLPDLYAENSAGFIAPVATGTVTFAIGSGAQAAGNFSIALGSDGNGSLIGANAQSDFSIAIGADSNITPASDGAIAIGQGAGVTFGGTGIAIGKFAAAGPTNAIAIGASAVAGNDGSVAVGNGATANNSESTAIGKSAIQRGLGFAGGTGADAGAFGVAIGGTAVAGSVLLPSAIAIGAATVASATASTAVGARSLASGDNSIAIGGATNVDPNTTRATAARAIAIGYDTEATAADAVAIGPTVTNVVASTVEIGSSNTNKVRFSASGALSLLGTAAMFLLPNYVALGLPTAVNLGGFIYVTDESGGPVPAFSDGVNWRRVTDRAIVT